jgi:hypothetical protein
MLKNWRGSQRARLRKPDMPEDEIVIDFNPGGATVAKLLHAVERPPTALF